jgi:molecular chaperone GrpE
MNDRQALADQLLDYLQTPPDRPDYLGNPDNVEMGETFDPYQMVGEWIALRQEIKQQNKLLKTSQTELKKALEVERSRNDQLQTQLNQLQANTTPFPAKPEEDLSLLRELLPVMDALDQAITYCQSQITDRTSPSENPAFPPPQSLWQKLLTFFSPQQNLASQELLNKSLIDTLSGNQEGIEMIRRSLLGVLQSRKITPIVALGQPFDSKLMYAIAQQPSDSAPVNTVLQEVVRGYRWGDRILREAQVIVASRPNIL